ncbi:MAG: phage holin family protein [Methylococcales bacterium]|nr:phage holin family protein [Methylococcales bacterium]
MDANVLKKTPEQTATPGDPATDCEVLQDAQRLLDEFYGLIHDRFRLAALETQRAGETLVVLIVAGVMMVILLVGSWLGLIAAAVLALIKVGLMASSAILLAVACHLLIALVLIGVMRRKSRYLRFSATRRSFNSISPVSREAKKS